MRWLWIGVLFWGIVGCVSTGSHTPQPSVHKRRAIANQTVFVRHKPETSPSEPLFIPAHGAIEHRRGLVLPYSLKRVGRGFGKCRRGKRKHPALDIYGVGQYRGLGTPIRSMVRSKVTMIGRPEDDPAKFGIPDRGVGTVVRTGQVLPRSLRLPGYGRVFFFTKNHGKWRTGTMVVTRGLEGRLKDHTIRYMHLGAVHPKLKVGDVLEPGQELGVMGSTAIMESWPHLHLDVEDPQCRRVDVAWLLGLGAKHPPCPTRKKWRKRLEERRKKRCRRR